VLSRLDYAWRLAATGLAFAALGLGGFVMALTVIPLFTCAIGDGRARERRAQGIIRASFRLYVFMLRRLGVLSLEIAGEERLASCRGTLVIANHPTLLDVVLIMALLPNAQCVVKHQLWRHPLLGPVVRAAGYLRNDRDAEALIESCRIAVASGSNLIIFPEGTRSVPGHPLRFQRGFAHIATLTGADLQLVTITCDPVTLVKGKAWYAIPDRRPAFRVEIGERLETAAFLAGPSRARGARKMVAHLEAYYLGKLQHG
jgi:1-acyl-sn-glycerol-3-phosphate acyltransferase